MSVAKKLTFVHCVDLEIARTQMFGVHFMPVWAYTLASYLRKIEALEIDLFDVRVQTKSKLTRSDIFLFSGINQDYRAISSFLTEMRQRFPYAKFVIGGPIAWSFQQAGRIDDLMDFDHIFVGDGEAGVLQLVSDLIAGTVREKIIGPGKRFSLQESLLLDRTLLKSTITRYYGAVLEVSRGCPFLCEFCDIRIQPDNNRSHTKPVSLLIEELNLFYDLGVRQVLLACDNLIGDLAWAESLCDALIEWRNQSGKSLSLYTWLTINLCRHPRLLEKLRTAGFDMLFIGVESFYQDSLAETAKVQNVHVDIKQSVQTIQSYGFVVVAGLIFGFDTDPENIVDITLQGILESGLISGDPSLLTALPGTPLYLRLRLSNRLRTNKKTGLGGFKYHTNIKYLKPADIIINDFLLFVRQFNSPEYQLNRFKNFLETIVKGENFIASRTAGYANLNKGVKLVVRDYVALYYLVKRLAALVCNFSRAYAIFSAIVYTANIRCEGLNKWFYLKFWLFNWSNSLLKYAKIQANDFDIASVDSTFDFNSLIPDEYQSMQIEKIPVHKIKAQRAATIAQLKKLVQNHNEKDTAANI